MELEWKYLDELYREKYFDKVVPPVYLKSEADKVIAYQKYKRCLVMARWCNRMFSSTFGKERYWQKWNRRWLELAEKFKETK
jgi:hypothetical protein